MLLFHGYAPTTAAHKLHRRQFVFTEVRMIRLSRTAEAAFGFIAARIAPAEAAFGFIAARIAQVARFVGYCSAVFTCVSHH
jgi:hypothetical protein